MLLHVVSIESSIICVFFFFFDSVIVERPSIDSKRTYMGLCLPWSNV